MQVSVANVSAERFAVSKGGGIGFLVMPFWFCEVVQRYDIQRFVSVRARVRQLVMIDSLNPFGLTTNISQTPHDRVCQGRSRVFNLVKTIHSRMAS